MSDINFTLPGSETVTLTGQTIDKLIRAGDGDAALLYLYILRTQGQSSSTEAAKALDKSKGWVASAMAMLSRFGLVQLDDNADVNANTKGVASAAATESPPEEPRNYTEDEVRDEIIKGTDFTIVVEETQRRLGKILVPDELLRLFGIYDNLRLPPEVILQLITHCINESRVTGDGRAPSVRYIEKEAYRWEREGIFSLEKAEEYLKALEERKSVSGEIKWIMQIKDREFSATQKRYVDGWIAMGFKPDAIAIAYDITMVKRNELNWAYMDGIIKNWHKEGLYTAAQVAEKDNRQKKLATGGHTKPGAQKHGNPNREEMERMTRLLNKIKEE